MTSKRQRYPHTSDLRDDSDNGACLCNAARTSRLIAIEICFRGLMTLNSYNVLLGGSALQERAEDSTFVHVPFNVHFYKQVP